MEIRQFRYSRDNLAYIVSHGEAALIVDGGAVADIIADLTARNLRAEFIANTHAHPDHTPGNDALQRQTGARRLSPGDLVDAGEIDLGGAGITVIPTPGHSTDSLTFYTGSALLSGDTLFNGTVGNCFTGDVKTFFESICTLLAYPDETLVYAGHDYVKESMAFAESIIPGDPAVRAYLSGYDPAHVFSTLADERKANPYLRFDDPVMIEVLQARGFPTTTAYERFYALMSIE
jgi:hydroxyacylglutathione hydrolase